MHLHQPPFGLIPSPHTAQFKGMCGSLRQYLHMGEKKTPTFCQVSADRKKKNLIVLSGNTVVIGTTPKCNLWKKQFCPLTSEIITREVSLLTLQRIRLQVCIGG